MSGSFYDEMVFDLSLRIDRADNAETKAQLEEELSRLFEIGKQAVVNYFLKRFDKGEKINILFALDYCLANGIEIPVQIIAAFHDCILAFDSSESDCLNDAFGYAPLMKGGMNKLVRDREGIKVYEAGLLLHEINPTLPIAGNGIFAVLGDRFGSELDRKDGDRSPQAQAKRAYYRGAEAAPAYSMAIVKMKHEIDEIVKQLLSEK